MAAPSALPLLALALVLAAPTAPAQASDGADEPGPWEVAADGSGRFTTIAAALAAAPAGVEVTVQPGRYRESLELDGGAHVVHGDRPGLVVLDGGVRPALRLTRHLPVRVSGLVLRGGSDGGAVAEVRAGQLALEACRLDVAPGGVGVDSSAQLVTRDCLVQAGIGSALRLAPGAGTALHGLRVAWDAGNFAPLLVPGPHPPVRLVGGQLGRLVLTRPQLVDAELLASLPDDGRLPVWVEPDRDAWPSWALEDQTHFATIQRAVDGAPERAVIQVAPGSYHERVGLLRPAELLARDGPGSVQLSWEGQGQAALWMNAPAGTLVTVVGLELLSDAGQGRATVQVNGGRLTLRDVTATNPRGAVLVVTDHHDASHVTLAGGALDGAAAGALVSGPRATLLTSAATVTADDAAVVVVDGASARLKATTLSGGRCALELHGPDARARLEASLLEPSDAAALVLAAGARPRQVAGWAGEATLAPGAGADGPQDG